MDFEPWAGQYLHYPWSEGVSITSSPRAGAGKGSLRKASSSAEKTEPPVGFEPTTARLRIESSTTELRWRGCTATTYRIGREVYAVVPMVVPKLAPRSASNRASNLAACCSTRYSNGLGAVAHLAQVPIDLPHHRLATVPHLAGYRVGAHGRPLVDGLEPRRAVGVPEHLGADLTRLPSGSHSHCIEQLAKVGDHRLLARTVAREEQSARRMLGQVP